MKHPILEIILRRLRERQSSPAELGRELASLDRASLDHHLEALLAHLDRSRTLLAVSQAVTGELAIEELFGRVLAETSRALSADRASLFVLDAERGELWTRAAQGLGAVIRVPANRGLVGSVATTGAALNVADAYAHPLFNPEPDRATGYKTRSVLAVPVFGKGARTMAVLQAINSSRGAFSEDDVILAGEIGAIVAMALENSLLYEKTKAREREVTALLETSGALSSGLDLSVLMETVVRRAAELAAADRASLFLIDAERSELWSRVAEGLDKKEIRFPIGRGVAGNVALHGRTMNIRNAYEEPLFNPDFDRATGYRTKTILCMPVKNGSGAVIGVIQLINKLDGEFGPGDERLLGAFCSQAGVALDNSRLFEATRRMKEHLEAVLESITNGVLTTDTGGRMTGANRAAVAILGLDPAAMIGQPVETILGRASPALAASARAAATAAEAALVYDLEAQSIDGRALVLNLNSVPLMSHDAARIGGVLVLEDVTREKRVKSTLSRYMSKEVVDRLMTADGQSLLGGSRQQATILFSDIRAYTSLTEDSDAAEIVLMLNEYFGYMVDAVFKYGGILDKFIGDALMAVFGAPFARPEQDPENAVRAALEMIRQLEVLNASRAARQKPRIKIGIGVSSGEVVCGNIGSLKRMEYTSIGDGVNLASRLEGATKQYGATLLIADSTHAAVKDRFVTREVDRIRVKGKKRPVAVHEVFCEAEAPEAAAALERVRLHAAALGLYRERRFGEAARAFEGMIARAGGDDLAELYCGRCRALAERPPHADWDGVWELTEK